MQDNKIEETVIACFQAYFNKARITINPPGNEEEWKSLALFINRHSLTAFFYQAITRRKIQLEASPDIIRDWAMITRKTTVFNVLLAREAGLILADLKKLDIYPILLKGFALHRIYEDILTRPTSDIDLLIKKDEYPAVRDYLLQNRFTYAMARDFRGTPEQYIELQENYCTEISFQKTLGSISIVIDLHWELNGIYDGSPLEAVFPIDQYPWQQYIEMDYWDEIAFNSLIPEMQFIHLAVHFAIHHQFQGAKWFLDLVFFINNRGGELDWKFIDSIVKEPDCRKILGVTLRLIDSFKINSPEGMPEWQHFWNGKALPYEFIYFRKRIFAEPSKTGQYMGNVLLPLNFTDKLKVLAYYMFNNEAISLWRTDNQPGVIPGFLQPFYLISRVYQDYKNKNIYN
ncbi:MAG: nucleotidyltransferase family protein [Syntrophomonadaceae bacterium]|nr:nucleotidyltransferase family protein [Syntrophomonadaceae bacterium]